jgi:hypothetical protein
MPLSDSSLELSPAWSGPQADGGKSTPRIWPW